MSVLRPAGYLERWHITRAALGLDPGVVSTARYSFNDNCPPPNHSLFIKALKNVVRRHTALRVRVPDVRSSAPVFTLIPEDEIDLSKLATFIDARSPSLDETVQGQFQTGINTESGHPLWRVVVYSDWMVVFVWHHAIGDGLSSIAFHLTLLDALQDLSENPQACAPLSNVFHPAIDQILDVSPSAMRLTKNIAEFFLPNSWTTLRCWTGEPVKSKPSWTVQVRFLQISPGIAQSLLTLCREHKSTITGMLHEVSVTTLSRVLLEKSPRKWRKILSGIAISYRHLTNVPRHDFCEHVSALSARPKIHTTFSWNEAKNISDALKQESVTGIQEIGLLKFLFGRFEAFFQGKLGEKREKGLEISNLGKIPPIDRQGPWTVDDFAWAQFDVPGAALSIGAVTSHTGALIISVRWGEGISDELGETFTKLFNEEILSMAQKHQGTSST